MHKKQYNPNKISLTFDADTYIKQFNVLGMDDYMNCEGTSHIMYAAILNKFKITMTDEEYEYFKEYQERVFDLVENLRELDVLNISLVFDYLDKKNPYLVDIIIMMWCMPRIDNFLSKRFYNKRYKDNILKYNHKIIDIIDQNVIKKFCIETLSKTNNVPIHCIDYIWFYMNTIGIEFSFYNTDNNAYIGFTMPEDKEDYDGKAYIDLGLHLEYMLEMNLGQVVYPNDPGQKGSLRNFIKNIVFNSEIVEKILTGKTGQNFRLQMQTILNNPIKYFGEVPEMLDDLIKIINGR